MPRGNSFGLYILIGLAAAARLVPHPWNVTPVGALGLFSGAYVRGPLAWLMPVAALIIGDAFLGFYHPVVMLCVYIGTMLSVVIGRGLLFNKCSLNCLGVSVIIAAVVFYLVSNFGDWIAMYPHTIEGLLLCYLNGLPFLGRSLAGDAMYTTLLFGLVEGALLLRARNEDVHVAG